MLLQCVGGAWSCVRAAGRQCVVRVVVRCVACVARQSGKRCVQRLSVCAVQAGAVCAVVRLRRVRHVVKKVVCV